MRYYQLILLSAESPAPPEAKKKELARHALADRERMRPETGLDRHTTEI